MRSAFGQRAIMFLLGMLVMIPGRIDLRMGDLMAGYLNQAAASGVVALLIYEIMVRSKKWLKLYTLPVYLAVGLFIRVALGDMLWALFRTGDLGAAGTILLRWLNLQRWVYYFAPGQNYFQLQVIAQVFVFMIAALILLRVSSPAPAASQTWRFAASKGELDALSGGYGGIEMDSTKSQTTRYLAASAILLGGSFRSKVLNHVKEKYRAVAPELGLDLGLLVRVCKFMEQRETRYRFLFVCLAVIAMVVGLIRSEAGLAIFVIGAWGLQGYKYYEEQNRFPGFFRKDRYDPDRIADNFEANLDADLVSGIPTDGQNTVVYQGFSPFVGAGIDLGGWSFAVDLSRPKEQMGKEEEPISFEVGELSEEIEDAIQSLGLEGAVVKDYLFVNGVDIREDKAVLPKMFGRPAQQVSPEILAQYMSSTNSRIRHYKWIRVHDWGNELVLSHFLRCVLKGENLFVEISRFLLTPLDTQYRRIDGVAAHNWLETVALFMGALFVGPLAALVAWLALIAKLGGFISRSLGLEGRMKRREIKHNPLYDYGIAQSIRQMVSSPRFAHYFQRLDQEMYVKIIEREMLDTIIEFLDDHNIDTSDIKERQTTILNQGVIVQGGDVQAESLAVGAGAQAVSQPGGQPKEKSRRSTRLR